MYDTIRNLLTMGVLIMTVGCAPVEMSDQPNEPNKDEKTYGPTPSDKPELINIPGHTDPDKSTNGDLGYLRTRMKAALDQVKSRELDTTFGSWAIFHGILGVGLELELIDKATDEKVNAVEYILAGKPVRGLRYILTKHGLDISLMEEQFVGQGHQDQYVAEIAQLGMPLDKELIAFGRKFTFGDLVNHTKMRASTKKRQELSWTLVVLSEYFGTDFSWTNEDRDKLHFTDLVRYELDESVENSACGGTHRLFGLTWAYYTHLQNGGKTEGIWKEVADKIEFYKKLAHKHQNSDGCFSTQYLSKPENEQNLERRISTTGHVLEWLALAMTDEELRQAWVQEAANSLSLMILKNGNAPLETGGLYHAAHGLTMYYHRLFGGEKAKILPPPPTK